MGDVSVLAVGCLDFIDQLKRYSNGLSFEPLVKLRYGTLENGTWYTPTSSLIIYKPTPIGVSPRDFFIDNFIEDREIFIKVKRKNSPLRALGLALFDMHHLGINYYAIEGWKQNEKKWVRYISRVDIPNDCYALRCFEFERVTFRRSHPLIINLDTWDLSSYHIAEKTLQNVIDVLNMSWQPKVQKILSHDCWDKIGIDIAGHVTRYHHRTRTITKRW